MFEAGRKNTFAEGTIGQFSYEFREKIRRALRNDVLLYYTFIAQSSSERTLKIGEHLAKLQAKW